MEPNIPFPGRILVTTDFSEMSCSAFPYAAAEAHGAKAPVELLHVVEAPLVPIGFGKRLPAPETMEKLVKEVIEKNEEKLNKIAADHFGALSPSTACRHQFGSVAEAIVEHAQQNNFGLIVMASHGYGIIERSLFGSVTERVMRDAPCPVLIVPCRQRDTSEMPPQLPYEQILVPTDLSPASLTSFRFAQYEAQRTDAHVKIVHVREQPFAANLLEIRSIQSRNEARQIQEKYRQGLEQRLEELSRQLDYGNSSHTVIDKSYSVSKTVTEYAAELEADLIVLTARGAGNHARWLGGVAERVVREANCPVMVVPNNP